MGGKFYYRNTFINNPVINIYEEATKNVEIGIESENVPTGRLVVNGAIKVGNIYSGISNAATTLVPAGGAGTIVFQCKCKRFLWLERFKLEKTLQ